VAAAAPGAVVDPAAARPGRRSQARARRASGHRSHHGFAAGGADEAPWLGHDLTAPFQPIIVFRDGTVTDGDTIAFASGEPGLSGCYRRDGSQIACDGLTALSEKGRALLDLSDLVITGNLRRHVVDELVRAPAPAVTPMPRPLVIAHRGNSRFFPENTIASLLSAFDAGADLVEVDISVTRDGVPVLLHDHELSATTNGRGRVADLTWPELRQLDAGRWKDRRFAGTRVPAQVEALRAARGRGRLYLDLKAEGLGAPIREALRAAGVEARDVIIAAWSPTQRADIRAALPEAPIVSLEAPPTPRLSGDQLKAAGMLASAIATSLPVFVYTVNDEATMHQLVEIGVAGIETDDPALLRRVLDTYLWPSPAGAPRP